MDIGKITGSPDSYRSPVFSTNIPNPFLFKSGRSSVPSIVIGTKAIGVQYSPQIILMTWPLLLAPCHLSQNVWWRRRIQCTSTICHPFDFTPDCACHLPLVTCHLKLVTLRLRFRPHLHFQLTTFNFQPFDFAQGSAHSTLLRATHQHISTLAHQHISTSKSSHIFITLGPTYNL